MNESRWSVIISLLILVIMRLLDSMLPKGYMFKIVKRWLVKAGDDSDDQPTTRRDDDNDAAGSKPR